MTPHLLTLLAATSSKSSNSGGSSYLSLLFLVAIFVALYFLILRPRQRRMRQQQSAARELTIGSEVMSVGGIMGTIVGMTDSTFDVEVADGIVLTFTRRAVNARPPGTGGTQDAQDIADDVPDPWDAPPEGEEGGPGGADDDDAGGGSEGSGQGRG